MSISDTRRILKHIISNDNVNVIVVSGVWGSGKTHLWREIKDESDNDAIKKSIYTSLYGAKDINAFKNSILRNFIGEDKSGSTFKNTAFKKLDILRKFIQTIHPALHPLMEASDAILPHYLRDKFIVIDDLERINENFKLDELLGFINEFSTIYKSKFLIIMNGDKLPEGGSETWDKYKEKSVDYEINHTISPEEAFAIAVGDNQNVLFVEHIKKAVLTCEINNIRVIKKILQLTSRALIDHQTINEAALSRVVPGIVLTGAVFYNEIDLWKNANELKNFFDTSGLLSILSDSETLVFNDKNKPAKEFIKEINVINNRDLISDTIILLQSALTDKERLNETIKIIASEELSIIAENNFFTFLNECYWNYQLSEEQVQSKAMELLKEAKNLNIYQISNLINSFGNIPEVKSMVDIFRGEWIAGQNGNKKSMHYTEIYESGKLRIDQAILDAVVDTELGNDEPHSYVFEAIEHQYKNKGWGERQLSACRTSTPESMENEIIRIEPLNLKDFDYYISNLYQNGGHGRSEFVHATDNYFAACRNIIKKDPDSKLAKLLKARLERLDVATE